MTILIILAAIAVIAGIILHFARANPTRQTERKNADSQTKDTETPSIAAFCADVSSLAQFAKKGQAYQALQTTPREAVPRLTGAALNGTSLLEERTTLSQGFYYEPLSDRLRRYMTGISFPSGDAGNLAVTLDDLRYLHIMHYDFNGNQTEGELICNKLIAKDLAEIFYGLFAQAYPIEKVLLIDKYNGNDTASMEDNNTSCFNYRPVEGTSNLSKHALGLAIDINPLYNPYITYNSDGTRNVSPSASLPYAERSHAFSYKIDAEDLCYRLFTEHGFTWGGNWNSVKDYQHFQKTDVS